MNVVKTPGRYRFIRDTTQKRYIIEEAIVEANSIEEAWDIINEGDVDWEEDTHFFSDTDWDSGNERLESVIEEPTVLAKEFQFLAGFAING